MARLSVSRINWYGASRPVNSKNCSAAWRMNISTPVTVRQPCDLASFEQQRRFGIVDRVEHDHRRLEIRLVERRFVDVRVHADRRAVDDDVDVGAVPGLPVDALAAERVGEKLCARRGCGRRSSSWRRGARRPYIMARATPPAPSTSTLLSLQRARRVGADAAQAHFPGNPSPPCSRCCSRALRRP